MPLGAGNLEQLARDHVVDELGPLLLAGFLISFLQGVVCVQFATYLQTAQSPRLFVKVIVYTVITLSFCKLGYVLADVWMNHIPHFGDFVWAASLHVISIPTTFSSTIPAAVCQIFYIERCWSLGRSWIFMILAVSTMILSQVGSVIVTHQTVLIVNGVKGAYPLLLKGANIMLSGTFVCDLLITGYTCWILWSNRTGFKQTDSILNSLIRSSMESAAPPTVWAFVNLVLSQYNVNNQWFFFFNFTLSHIYITSLMYTVNNRAKMASQNATGGSSGGLQQYGSKSYGNKSNGNTIQLASRRQAVSTVDQSGTQVYVDVDVEVQRDFNDDTKKEPGFYAH